MKYFKISGSLFKCLAFAGLLIACNNEDVVTPTETARTSINDQNARTSPLLRLVDDNGRSLQYIKSGNFFGNLSRVGKGPWGEYYDTYTYDSIPVGNLWITRNTYKSSDNSFVKEHKFIIANGVCVLSQTDTGDSYGYEYNPQGYLSEVKKYNQGILVESWKYKYDWTYRLSTIEHKNGGNPDHKYHFSYNQIQDKYPLNIVSNGFNIGGVNDKYLPFFGKHSSPKIHAITDQNLLTNKSIETHYDGYQTDSDGLVTSVYITKYGGNWTETFKYSSTTWQGLP